MRDLGGLVGGNSSDGAANSMDPGLAIAGERFGARQRTWVSAMNTNAGATACVWGIWCVPAAI
jgi:hypothetical protein